MVISGIKAERDLVHLFWEAGFAVLRSPASGVVTVLPRPDLIAGSKLRNKFFVLEIKTIRKDILYITNEQIMGLLEFANRLGFEAILGVKFKHRKKDILFLNVPKDLEKVKESNNYKIAYAQAIQMGLSFGELIGEYYQQKIIE